MQQSVQKKDSKPKSKENETKIDKILAQDFKKDLHTPKREAVGLLSSNLHPPPKKQEKQSYTLAQIIQNSKKEGEKPTPMSETQSGKFFMYGGNIMNTKSRDKLGNAPTVQAKDYKQAHGLRTSEIKPPKNPQQQIPDKNGKRMTMFFSKDLQTPTDRSHSKGPPIQANDLADQVGPTINRPPKRRQTDILESTKVPSYGLNRAVTKEENKNMDFGYNMAQSEKIKPKSTVGNTLLK